MYSIIYSIFIFSGVQVVPGTPGPVENAEEAYLFCEQYGLPVIFKAAFGGGGRGMRVVRKLEVRIIVYEESSAVCIFGHESDL